ncbi:MAG: tail fiber domain-containing protein [Verrucomicrobia bacterium]|nr:tail fiber domain-containing protein [Verrucomicrobiota bacterium]
MKPTPNLTSPRALAPVAIRNFQFSILILKFSPLVVLLALLAGTLIAAPLGTAFTYQGHLRDGGQPASGIYDLRFTVYDALANGGAVSDILTNPATPVANGLFVVALDFGPGVFAGGARWLAIGVRTNGGGAFTPLTPRQPLTPAPHALFAPNAGVAASAPASGLTGTLPDARLSANVALLSEGASFAGLVSAPGFAGNGLLLSNLNATKLTVGTLPDARLSSNVALLDADQNFTGTTRFAGVVTLTNTASTLAGSFTGDGGGLTNLGAAALAGTVADARLSANVALLSEGASFAGLVSAPGFAGNGPLLSNLNASRLTLGTLPDARLSGNVPRIDEVWLMNGNSGTTAAHFLGTRDEGALEFRVNSLRALRLEPHGNGTPNLIGGADNNVVYWGAVGAVIAGGGGPDVLGGNSISASFGFIAGGDYNDIDTDSDYSAIGGGYENNVADNAPHTTIAGGDDNDVGADSAYSVIGGGGRNDIGTNSYGSAVGGGYDNNIGDNSREATIAGGDRNDIGTGSPFSAIGGGYDNNIGNDSSDATIAGGYNNNIGTNSDGSAVGGGYDNNIAANAPHTTIAGGHSNNIGTNSDYSVVGGGADNNIAANASYATITGGNRNNIGVASTCSAIGGGWDNTIAAYANYATIPGGRLNAATNYAFAAGRRAKANHTGAFVWGDSTDADVASATTNSVTMRAVGGYRLFSDSGLSAGVRLASGGGSWTSLSDRNAKENFQAVDAPTVLARVAALPLATWNYKSQDASIRHIGPVSQDFKAAFAVGESDTGITGVDADGVALAAIQGLNQKVEEQAAAIKAKETEIAELQQRLARLEALLAKADEHSTSQPHKP